jgi:hypothetical protein
MGMHAPRRAWVPALLMACAAVAGAGEIGSEKAVPRHLVDGEEFQVPLGALLAHGEHLFRAAWTIQDGGGRPLTKGTGEPLANAGAPLVFPRNFNRISAPDANSCFGCHAVPRIGGGGDIVANVFVLGQRFDFVTFDDLDSTLTGGSLDELGRRITVDSVANERLTLGMFGAGYIEMLAREMTAELQAIRDGIAPGGAAPLHAKGIGFGVLARDGAGRWDTTGVEGLPAASLLPPGPNAPPSLVIRPFHQAGRVVSLREFSNNAFNHHHGIQSTERFGVGTDPDGDGVVDEMTRADVTAVSVFQATLPVPGQVIPRVPEYEAAIRLGEQRFGEIGCADCHVPSLALSPAGAIYTEPNPYNPPGNLRPGEAPELAVDLSSDALPQPRLRPDRDGWIHVPAYTDLKLHYLCDGPDDPNAEPLDMQHPPGSAEFFAGNCRFLTKKLWGAANEPPFFHHGKFTTLREAVLAHGADGAASRAAFQALPAGERDAVIEFLKSLRVLPEGTRFTVVDEHGRPRVGTLPNRGLGATAPSGGVSPKR